MQPILCPNGHPNRPGTRICAVCLALIPPPEAAQPAPESPAMQPAPPASNQRSRRGCWILLLLLLLLLALAIALAFLFFYPIRQRASYLATAVVATLPTVAQPAELLPTATTFPTPPPSFTTVAEGPLPTSPPPASPTVDPDASPTLVATITPLPTVVGVVLTPTAELAAAGTLAPDLNLLQNGDFHADWVSGWERESSDLNGAQSVEVRLLAGDPPQPMLYVGKSGAGALNIQQHVVLTDAADDLRFQARLRLAGTRDGAAEGRSALMLIYEDADGKPLGTSVWIDGRGDTSTLWGGALPAVGPTTALRVLAPGWQAIDVSLAGEFADRLPDLDPAAVRRITVRLIAAGSDGCPPDACTAELTAAQLSLAADESRP